MNIGLWLQYGVIAVIVVACVLYTAKKLRASAKDGSCAGGCDGCGGSCCSTDEPAQQDESKPVRFIASQH
jgi:hypothetical protein